MNQHAQALDVVFHVLVGLRSNVAYPLIAGVNAPISVVILQSVVKCQ